MYRCKLSLAGAATSIIFVATRVLSNNHDKRVYCNKTCLLSQQKYACCDKHIFVMTNICCNKHNFAMTKYFLINKIFSWQELFCCDKCILLRQTHVCRDNTCLLRQNFCHDKMILVAAPASDSKLPVLLLSLPWICVGLLSKAFCGQV